MAKENLREQIVELIGEAVIRLPEDVKEAIRKAHDTESNPMARNQLANILDNVDVARQKKIPMCQDTGILVFYVEHGINSHVNQVELEKAIKKATQEATCEIPLRPNVVHPLTRENTDDNTGKGQPIINFKQAPGSKVRITVLPKGAGSENMSGLCMLNPSDGKNAVKEFVLETVSNAGGKPCPPTIVGVGIGASADKAMAYAKKSLLRPVGNHNNEKEISALEKEILSEINELGIGPMGVGGDTTSLAVHIETGYCHTASLPVAVNLQCWAARRASMELNF